VFYALGDKRPRVHESALIAPEAVLIGDVTVHADVTIWPGAVLRGDMGPIVVGEGSSIQDNAIIHESTTIGRRNTIAHHALVHEVVTEDDVLIANGALVFGGVHVGAGALIGAGAVMNGGEVEPGALMLGVPARKIETNTDISEIIAKGTRDYADLLQQYRAGFAQTEPERFR
jgi:carbonic anhydrase/acetyltransferase-like protein (isoleucine patch superfamily)